MELPEPFVPGWYSTDQIREMLGITRQYVSLMAKREGWRIKKLGASHLYDVDDVQKYLVAAGKIQPSSDLNTSQQ